jgi:hypothetical protein
MKITRLLFLIGTILAGPTMAQDGKDDPDRLHVNIYPIMVWAPIFGANVNLPSLPDVPSGGPGIPSGSATRSFNGAAFAGVDILKGNWLVEVDGLWAGLSAERTATPKLKVDLDVIYGHGAAGFQVYKGLYLTGGVRRLALSYDIKLADFPEFSRKPGIWDPLVGLELRRDLGRKWKLIAGVDGGGFGVGADVDVAAKARVDWRFAKHFGATLGYGYLYVKISNTVASRTFTASQSLNGPILGFGIYF